MTASRSADADREDWRPRPESSLGIIPRTKRVFEHAGRASRRLGHRCPQPEHLLLALYSVPEGVAGQILAAELGATQARARESLADLLSARAPELAEWIRRRPRRRLARRWVVGAGRLADSPHRLGGAPAGQ